MYRSNKGRSSGSIGYTGLGTALGLAFGGLVGWIIGSPVVFAGGAMVLGLAIGSAMDRRGHGSS